MKVGDRNKLQVIKARAEQGRITYELDRKYVEKLMAYYNYDEPPPQQKPYQSPPQQKPYQPPPQQNNPNSCSTCGNQISVGDTFCTNCGTQNNNQQQSQPPPQHPQQNYVQGKPSAAWWLLPIFFSFIGGIISWVCIKDRDPRMAKNTLILGILITVVPIIASIVIALGMSLPFLGGYNLTR